MSIYINRCSLSTETHEGHCSGAWNMSGLSWLNVTVTPSPAPAFSNYNCMKELYMRLFLLRASNPGHWMAEIWMSERALPQLAQAVRRSLWILFPSLTVLLQFSVFSSFCSLFVSSLASPNFGGCSQKKVKVSQIGVNPSWANCIFPWWWFGITGFYQGVPPLGLPRDSSIYISTEQQRTAMKPLSHSGLDKRFAFWCGFGQLLTRVIPSPCV